MDKSPPVSICVNWLCMCIFVLYFHVFCYCDLFVLKLEIVEKQS